MPVWSRARKARLLRFAMNLYPPFLGAGIRVRHIAGDFREVRVHMGLNRLNRNYVGTQFGGSLYAMTDPFFMLMLMENLGRDYVVWDKAANIEFVSPGKGPVHAHFSIDQKLLDEVRERTAGGEKYLPRCTPKCATTPAPWWRGFRKPCTCGSSRACGTRPEEGPRVENEDMHADLVIVGAGMVGSALALALEGSGLEVLLVDGGSLDVAPFKPEAPYEPRVSALSEASRRILQRLHAWDGIVARRAEPYREMQVWDGSGTGRIGFSAASVHAEVLGHIVENRVVQDALLERLHDSTTGLLANARLEQMRHSGDDWLLTLADGRQLRAPLVVAADGANSAVRRLAGCATREWDYLHHAIVTSVRCENAHRATAWQRFTDDGPLAFLPLPDRGDEHWCSIVWSTTPEQAERLMALDEDGFRAALGEAFERRLGAILHADRRLCIPLRQRHAKRYVEPGLALVGDAAHTIHPLAGQGVNLGFLDAAVLSEVLLHALERGERLADERVLSRFERRRMPHNLGMMTAMEGFERLFQADRLPLRWLRNAGLRLVDGHHEAKALFVRQALGLSGDLPALARV